MKKDKRNQGRSLMRKLNKMVKGSLAKTVRILLIAVTFLICLLGLAIFAVGIWASVQKQKNIEELLGTGLYSVATYVFIATGISIAFLSSLGCCGAWKEERFKLGLYFLVLLIAFVLLLAGAAMGFVFKDKVEEKLHHRMNVTVQYYGKKEPVTNAWDAIQTYFQCCGFSTNTTDENYKIWEKNEYLKKESQTVPMSCCKDMEKKKECQSDPKNNVHKKDCYVLLKNYLRTNSKILGAVGIAIALFLVIGMILTSYVFRALKLSYTRDLMQSESARK